jgi:hypothetical protein
MHNQKYLTLQVGTRRIYGRGVAGGPGAAVCVSTVCRKKRCLVMVGLAGSTTRCVATYPMTAHFVSSAPRLLPTCYSLTTFECILLESTFGVAVKPDAVESPAVGETR